MNAELNAYETGVMNFTTHVRGYKINGMLGWPRWIILIGLVFAGRAAGAGPTTTASTRPDPVALAIGHRREAAMKAAAQKGAMLLHLPGIGGQLGIDRRMTAGLKDGGVKAKIVIYDWTEYDAGIHALHAYDRNQAEAEFAARLIVAHHEADPDSPIFLTGHSGGCAIATWALEKLPQGIVVDQVLLMAPALSPTYDLSKALRHVRGKMYCFTSTGDSLVLYTGTRMFGTMDGLHVEAAGYGGFVMPAGADAQEYRKLVSEPYKEEWGRYGDWGDHIGPMARAFAEAVLAPLVEPAKFAESSTTKPTAMFSR